MLLVIIVTLVTLIATALPSAADAQWGDRGSKHRVNPGHIFKYRDANGKLVISNQPPPAGAEVESQREATLPSAASDTPERPAAPRPAPERLPSYVDLNPLELQRTGVEDSEAYWKKFVTGVVKNRSGFTTATGVMVRTACTLGGRPADTGAAFLGTIGPCGEAAFQIPIILHVQQYWKNHRLYTPELGPVRCETQVTYDANR
jgi:hypothetical protein